MINAIIKGIFNLVISLFNAILSPVIGTITALFPAVATYIGYISTFLGYATTYVRTVLSLLLISDTMILAIFDYFAIMYAIHVATLAVKFGLTVYQKLKI